MCRRECRRSTESKALERIFIREKFCFGFFTLTFNFFSEMPAIGPFSFSNPVMNEGDFAQLSCIVNSGDEPLTISWSFHGDRVGPDTGIEITNLGSRMSILVISQVGPNHQGKYTCKAKNNAGVRTHTTELKVNGRSERGCRVERGLFNQALDCQISHNCSFSRTSRHRSR
jgi:hypothetical protein